MIFIPIPLPRKVQQTSYCTHLLFSYVLQTGLCMGMGMNGTAQGVRGARHLRGRGAAEAGAPAALLVSSLSLSLLLLVLLSLFFLSLTILLHIIIIVLVSIVVIRSSCSSWPTPPGRPWACPCGGSPTSRRPARRWTYHYCYYYDSFYILYHYHYYYYYYYLYSRTSLG